STKQLEPALESNQSQATESAGTRPSERLSLDGALTPARGTYVGLFLVTLVTLMYMVLLTRIFSVSMWHHFAFMSISLALFGMSVGAVIVQVFRTHFAVSKTQERLAQSTLLFAFAIVFSFLTHLSILFAPRLDLLFFYSVALTYVVLAIPFVCSGVAVCLVLTRFPRQVSGLYAADLAVAATGWLAVLLLLYVADGPSAVLLVAAIAGCAAIVFARATPALWLRKAAAISTVVLVGLGAGNAALAAAQQPALYLLWAKGAREPRPLYEK